MKKAFTMIELVIVILGILASLAVPKLAATKTDAEVTKIVVDMKNSFDRIIASYIAHDELAAALKGKSSNGTSAYNAILSLIGGDPKLSDDKDFIKRVQEEHPWTVECFIISYKDGSLQINEKKQPLNPHKYGQICKALYAHPAVKEWVANGIKFGGESRIFKED